MRVVAQDGPGLLIAFAHGIDGRSHAHEEQQRIRQGSKHKLPPAQPVPVAPSTGTPMQSHLAGQGRAEEELHSQACYRGSEQYPEETDLVA